MSLALDGTIKKLEAYNDSAIPILSVYLAIPKDQKKLLSTFEKLVDESLTSKEKNVLEQNILYSKGFLEEFKNDRTTKGLALFSGDNAMWEVVKTQFAPVNLIVIQHSPFLNPLLEQFEEYRRFLIVLADKEKAKYFTYVHNHVEDEGEINDPSVPQKVKGRNLLNRAGKIDRHIEEHLHRHLKLIGKSVEEFVKNKPINAVIIGGHKDLFTNIKKHLPLHLQQRVQGEVLSELNISMNEIVSKCKSTIDQINKGLSLQQATTPNSL